MSPRPNPHNSHASHASHASHTPSGYCRSCGYAMDPGRCPECGADCPDVTPLPPRSPWPLIRQAAMAAAVPPALVGLMVVIVNWGGLGPSTDPFLLIALPAWFLVCAAVLLVLTVYALAFFIRHDRRTWRLAAILLLVPFLGVLGIVIGWAVLFARFGD